MSYSPIVGHRTMVFDDNRNGLYAKAIKAAVDQSSVVIDVGAGSGIHGLMAAEAGASKVYLVEPSTELDVATRVANLHGLAEQIIPVRSTIEEAHIDVPADVILSVFTGNFLLEEDLLPSLFFARDHYLSDGGTMIPNRAMMQVVPVSAQAYFDKHVACWSKPALGIDYSFIRQFAANNIYYDDFRDLHEGFLSRPAVIYELDFMRAASAACQNRISIEVEQDGDCHGILGWFDTQIGDAWLSTSPQAPRTHWSQAFMPLDPPLNLTSGDVIDFELQRPEFGEWSWTVTHAGVSQRHSTFLSEPISSDRLRKKSESFHARLDERGLVALQIMQRLNGKESVRTIASDIAQQYPGLFPETRLAVQFVLSLVDKFC